MSDYDSITHSVNYSRSICWLRILQVPILMFWTTHLALGITFRYEKALLWQLWFRLIACMKPILHMKLVGSCRFLTQPKITRLFFGKLREFVELRLHADNGKLSTTTSTFVQTAFSPPLLRPLHNNPWDCCFKNLHASVLIVHIECMQIRRHLCCALEILRHSNWNLPRGFPEIEHHSLVSTCTSMLQHKSCQEFCDFGH
jgi:hypothetical protein